MLVRKGVRKVDTEVVKRGNTIDQFTNRRREWLYLAKMPKKRKKPLSQLKKRHDSEVEGLRHVVFTKEAGNC